MDIIRISVSDIMSVIRYVDMFLSGFDVQENCKDISTKCPPEQTPIGSLFY